MLLTGTFRRSVDEKFRIAIPKKLRDVLEGTDANSDSRLYITPGTDGSLSIYSPQSFSRLADKLSEGSPTAQNTRAFSRMFYAQTQCVEMDGQGRIRIDPELVQLGQLEKEVMMIGVGDHVELWDAAVWEAYRKEQQARYDELAENAFGE